MELADGWLDARGTGAVPAIRLCGRGEPLRDAIMSLSARGLGAARPRVWQLGFMGSAWPDVLRP